MKFCFFSIYIPLSLAIACGNSTDSSTPNADGVSEDAAATSCEVAGRTGQVECGGLTSTAPTCSAGTYCYQDEDKFFRCKTGCTSDQNCGSTERCEKCNKSVGSCVNCTTPSSEACKAPQETSSSSSGLPVTSGSCERSNFDDHWCTDAKRKKAYNCDDDAEPAKELDCVHPEVGPSWVYCCMN